MFIQSGDIPANSTVGRMLMNLVDSVPQIKSQEFEAMMNNNMQVREGRFSVTTLRCFVLTFSLIFYK